MTKTTSLGALLLRMTDEVVVATIRLMRKARPGHLAGPDVNSRGGKKINNCLNLHYLLGQLQSYWGESSIKKRTVIFGMNRVEGLWLLSH